MTCIDRDTQETHPGHGGTDWRAPATDARRGGTESHTPATDARLDGIARDRPGVRPSRRRTTGTGRGDDG
jgi:hypothetical protein